MSEKLKKHRVEIARERGRDAVRRKPYHSPSNPFDQENEPECYEAWEEGATSAGWNEIYTNGVLNKSER